MKHINPTSSNQNNSNSLNEGEEITLDIKPQKADKYEDKPHFGHDLSGHQDANSEHSTATADVVRTDKGAHPKEYEEIKKIHHHTPNDEKNIAPHAKGDFYKSTHSAEKISKPEINIDIASRPMIDLKPGSQNSSSPAPSEAPGKKSARQKLKDLRAHKHWHNAKLVVGTVLVFLLIFNSQWFISQFIYLFNKPKPQATSQQPQSPPALEQDKKNQAEVVGPQNEIIIPKIGATAPLVFINTNNEPDVLTALRDGVVHYYGTAMPGEVGNSVFFGHSSNDWWEAGNYKFVFILLEKLTVGDTYEIHYNSRKYVYLVTQTKIVQPNDLSVLNQTAEPTSTLITCTPPGTSWQRFIVTGKQISPTFDKTAQADTGQNNTDAKPTENNTNQTLPSAPANIWEQISSFFGRLFGQNNSPDKQQGPVIENASQRLPEVN